MFLQPIEKPRGLVARIAYWLTRRQFGKVITPLKISYARVPESFALAQAIQKFSRKGIKLEPGLTHLLHVHVSQLNGCHFCIDIGQAMAVQHGVSLRKFGALDNYREDPQFSERERAALAYVEEVTLNKRVQPETFARLQEHFNEREIVELAFLNAIGHYYNVLNISFGIESDGLCALAQARRP